MLVQGIGFSSSPTYRLHDHAATGMHEFHYFLDGKGSFSNGEHEFPIIPGCLFYSRPTDRHGGSAHRPDQRLQMYYLAFKASEEIAELVAGMAGRFSDGRPSLVGRGMAQEFAEIHRRSASADPQIRRSADYRFLALLCDLGVRQAPPLDETTRRYIEESRSLMLASLHSGLDLDGIARRLGIDKSYYVRLFKQAVGVPPMRYFLGMRLDVARFRLANGQEPLRRIALDLGFHDEFHFSRQFKTRFGQSPQAYRRTGGMVEVAEAPVGGPAHKTGLDLRERVD